MRFLFLGPGFPGVAHSESGSGIGTYLQCLAHELKTRGHECHLIIWSNDGQEYTLHQDGLTIYLIPHAYWRGVERLFPDSRDMATVFRKVLALESQRAFDAIEVESDEGVSKWVLQYFKAKSFLRVFTTLEQMARIKEVPENRILRHRLARQQKSFRCTSMVLVP